MRSSPVRSGPVRSGEADGAEPGHRKWCWSPLLVQLEAPCWPAGLLQAAERQQAEEQEALAHVGGTSQHLVAANQLLPGGGVAAVPQEDLQGGGGAEGKTEEEVTGGGRRSGVRGCLNAPTRLHPGVDAHVLEKRPLGDGSHAGHAPSGHPPQVAEVHVGGEVS